ncbi:MAG: ABC transporter permease [Actinomycetes bacterium]
MKTFLPPQWQSGGSNGHFLGTDELGRDLLSRIFYGIRESLLIGPISVILASILGLTFGLLSGYRGGWLDSLLMRITDGILSIPILLLAISVIGVIGASTLTLIVVLAISQWMSFVRLIRAEVIQLRQKQFILASRAIGANDWRIMFKHLLPHLIPSALVLATLSLPNVILLAAGLDFLGIGSTPPKPTLGGMISGGLKYLVNAPWMAIAPGLALMFLVVGINMVAESVREKLEQSA